MILDPGLGFGKSRRQNFELLAHLDRLHSFRLPLLVGTSRKSFVQAIAAGEGLDAPKSGQRARSYWRLLSSERLASSVRALPQPLLAGDAAAVVAAALAGAHVVRVHDVASVIPALRIADAILEAGA